MYVPNYIPDPLEVPGNVTLERYPVRLAFIRRVTLYHLAGMILVALVAAVPSRSLGIPFALGMLAVLLLNLDVLRIVLRGSAREATFSAAALPLLLMVAGWCARELLLIGIPVWALLVGPAFAMVYTAACGRDYSFVGCGLLSLIASTVVVSGLASFFKINSTQAAWALAGNTVYLTYFVYDLASLMARRRQGEELAAVTDLYRDVFNIFGYIPRVLRHWKEHKIWALK